MNLQTKYYSLEYSNGAVRRVKCGNTEVVRMIYAAVRDHNWGTIEPEIIAEKIQDDGTYFVIHCELKYQKAGVHFEAVYTISGKENRLEFSMTGEAKSTFMTNRTGFCILHPVTECAGKTCTVFHPGGTSATSHFPEFIAPIQPMKNIVGLTWNPSAKIQANLQLSGDIFEMEDQRNWTDASFKTYCRPLEKPFPYEIKKGEKIQQKIILEIEGKPFAHSQDDVIRFTIDNSRVYMLPEIGVEAASRAIAIEPDEAGLMGELPLSHLRSEVKLFSPHWQVNFEKAINESGLLRVPLFLVLCFSKNYRHELAEFQCFLQDIAPAVSNILVVAHNHLPDDLIFSSVYPELKKMFPAAKIGSGVNAYFAELNRNRPQATEIDFISFTASPQVHAFDNDSLVENMQAMQYVVETARKLFPEKPVYVSPVTLRQRFNVVATVPEQPPLPGELPSQVDPRQNTVFAAQWILGSLKYLAQSGAEIVTFFESVGWRGLIQGNYPPPVPEKFTAKVKDIFPVFRLLKALKGFQQVVFSVSDSPLELDGLTLKNIDNGKFPEQKILLANFSSQPKKVRIANIHSLSTGESLFSAGLIQPENDEYEIPSNDIVVITVL